LFLDVTEDGRICTSESIVGKVDDLSDDEMEVILNHMQNGPRGGTCALDIADEGAIPAIQVATAMNLTWTHVVDIIADTTKKFAGLTDGESEELRKRR
jgi:hypothetical protein